MPSRINKISALVFLALLSALFLHVSGCDGGSSAPPPPKSTNVVVSVSPKRGGLATTQTLFLTATVQNDPSNAGVTWTASGGSCGSACGTFSSATANPVTYTAPSTSAAVTVTATSNADSSKSASAIIGVTDLKGVFSWRGMEGDNSRQGVNSKEFALTTDNVTSSTFGKLFSCPVDAFVYAQPLYIANLTIGPARHNVVLVATENDTLYALDADDPTCKSVWSKSSVSLIPAGETIVSAGDVSNGNIGPLVGITGTPVIDPGTNTLYVVATSKSATSIIQRLHAIDLTTGQEKPGGPAIISASLPGTGLASNGTTIPFDPQRNNQRPGLLLSKGVVYVSWASHDDTTPYHGWVIGYDALTLTQVAAYSPTPNGSDTRGEGGIWMSGAAPAADANGNIFLSVGNGTFDDTTNTVPPVPPNNDFGDSVLKLSTASNSLSLTDFFTPVNQSNLNAADNDLGSGGVVLFSSGGSSFLLTAGKDGNIYLLNQSQLGRFAQGTGGSNAALQDFNVIQPPGFRSTPAFFNNAAYIAGQGSPLFMIPFSSNTLALPPYTGIHASSETYTVFGTTPVVSALGASNGIVWTIDVGRTEFGSPTDHAVLRAYDAMNLATTLYSSGTNPTRDQAGLAVKFSVPTVANGKVYVGTQTTLDVFGLLPN